MSILGTAADNALGLLEQGLQALRLDENSIVTTRTEPGICAGVCDRSILDQTQHGFLLLDGEIENLKELQADLGIETMRPAAVLLEGWRRWRLDLLPKLFGDYSLALWNRKERTLVLARDPEGARPLLISKSGGTLRFASTARGLTAAPDFPMKLDTERLLEWLLILPRPSRRTFFQNIERVLPGHAVVWKNGSGTEHCFYDYKSIPLLKLKDHREYAEGLREVLSLAVARRLESTPGSVGAELSGGLDSSSVAAMAAGYLAPQGRHLTAFTAFPAITLPQDSKGRFSDERAHAAAVAAMYPNIDQILVSSSCSEYLPAIDILSSAHEVPIANPSNAPWALGIQLRARARNLHLLLIGVMGNNTISWGGSRAMFHLLREMRWGAAIRLAQGRHRHGARWRNVAYDAISPFLPFWAHAGLDRLRGRSESQIHLYTGLRPEFAEQLGISPDTPLRMEQISDGRELRICRMKRREWGTQFAARLRIARAPSADPTADRRVVEFCLSVPEEHYRYQGLDRSLIREAMCGRLPDVVLQEKRKGLQAADTVWHLARERDQIEAELRWMEKHDLLAQAIDIPALKELLTQWPENPSSYSDFTAYALRLLRAVTLGRFVRRMEEGTLFKDSQLVEEAQLTSTT